MSRFLNDIKLLSVSTQISHLKFKKNKSLSLKLIFYFPIKD